LLHVDGRHLYADVRHDFESWRAKMSDRGVVLFHDTNVRQGDFGVFRFWEEARAHYPHFEFMHGHGLGVLGVGSRLPEAVRDLFAAAAEPDTLTQLRDAYGRLGAALSLQISPDPQGAELAQKSAELAQRIAEEVAVRPRADELAAALQARSFEVGRLSGDLAARADESRRLEAMVGAQNDRIIELTAHGQNSTRALEA